MGQLPVYIDIIFIATTFLTLVFVARAVCYAKMPLVIMAVWLIMQATIGLHGFYTVTHVLPPRFALLLIPPLLLVVALFTSKRGKVFISTLNLKTLTLLHVVRLPVELTLYWLYLHKAVPRVMTFEGRNYDILCALTAPFIYYFGYVKYSLGRRFMLIWNMVCLLLLVNIVIIAVLSAPFPFQKIGFGQPNIALLYFPFIWLPCFIVPAVLLAHLACIKKLWRV